MPKYTENDSRSLAVQKPLVIANPVQRGAIALAGPMFIGFTLDTSTSMHQLLSAAATGFNVFLVEQKKLGSANFSFATFSDSVLRRFSGVDICSVEPVTADFLRKHNGGTALLDAIGDIIVDIAGQTKAVRGRSRVLCAILTDGMENSSRRFTHAEVFQAIHYRRSVHNWEFVFICDSEASERYGLSLGIQKTNITRFNTSEDGVRLLMGRLSKAAAAYRLGDKKFAGYLTDGDLIDGKGLGQ